VALDNFFEQTASGDGLGRDSSCAGGWAGGKRQPARCSRKTQERFAIAFMAKKFLHRCMSSYAGVHVHFLRGGWYASRQVEHHARAGVYVKQVLCASAYTFAYTLATGCAYALMYVQFGHLALGNEDGGGSARL